MNELVNLIALESSLGLDKLGMFKFGFKIMNNVSN